MSTETDYSKLQTSIDKVIGKIGLEKTICLMESFINNTSIKTNEQERIKLITQFLKGVAISVYELEERLFLDSQLRDYKDARMCCFHLIRKYSEDTYSKIGLAFQCSERVVSYGFNKTEERLEFPKGNAKFNENYNLMEARLIEFIGKIN